MVPQDPAVIPDVFISVANRLFTFPLGYARDCSIDDRALTNIRKDAHTLAATRVQIRAEAFMPLRGCHAVIPWTHRVQASTATSLWQSSPLKRRNREPVED